MIRIGDYVQATSHEGVVHDVRGSASGEPEFDVRTVERENCVSAFFPAAAIAPASPTSIDPKRPVYLNGGIGRVIEQIGDEVTVEVVRPRRSGMVWRHVYRVPRGRVFQEDR